MREITIEKVGEVVTPELDYGFIDQTNDEGEPYEIIFKGEETQFSEASPMKIEDLEKYLQQLKEKGANFVSFLYNVDHYEYVIEGYKVN